MTVFLVILEKIAIWEFVALIAHLGIFVIDIR
jgi:hypothetical protein